MRPDISHNIPTPDSVGRSSAVLGHLEGLFGEVSGPLIVMLQEVRHKSLQVILKNSWVPRNFVLSNVDPPESLYTTIPGESFILKQLDWRAAPYFGAIAFWKCCSNCFSEGFGIKFARSLVFRVQRPEFAYLRQGAFIQKVDGLVIGRQGP